MVPEGWLHTTFDRHIDCLTGYAFKSESYTNDKSGYKLLRGDNIEPGKLRWIDEKYWPKEQSKILDKYQLEEGDFVIALDRTWISAGLKVAEIKADDIPCLLVQRVARVRANSSLEQALLRQYFSGNKFEQYVKSVQTATAVPHISPNDIKNFSLLLPPIEEQKKIAQILSTWDKAIATTEKLLENSQKQKQALMQQLLTGKKRFSGFNGVWEHKRISDICKIGAGQSAPQDEKYFTNGTYDFLRVSDIGAWPYKYAPSSKDKINDIAVKELNFKKIAKGSTLFTKSGASLLLNQRVLLEEDTFIVSHLGYAKPNDGVDSEFLYYQICNIDFNGLASGTSLPALQLSALSNIKVYVPKMQEQKKISGALSLADKEIQLLRGKLNLLMIEKRALMQQLLTGKKRVKLEG